MNMQNEIINTKVQKIHNSVKERVNKLEEQETALSTVVQLKLYSFCHYLRKIDFKGYAKWCILNQSMQEEHPQNLSLFNIIELKAREAAGK